ncbi:MAG: helix-turn-helix domain-containing protein [Candidatus Aquicultorales bacterium]
MRTTIERELFEREIKQADICRLTGLDPGQVSRTVRGLQSPSQRMVEALAKFGIEVSHDQ